MSTGWQIALTGIGLILITLVLLALYGRTKSKASKPTSSAKDPLAPTPEYNGRDPRQLTPGYLFDYGGVTYQVGGTLHYRTGAYTWVEHLIDNVKRRCWLSVVEDEEKIPSLLTILWDGATEADLTPGDTTINYDGVAWQLDEHGFATYTTTGTTGLPSQGRVEYYDYEGSQGSWLSFERFGDDSKWEVGIGQEILDGALTIYPTASRL